ncbi:MAG TPA: bifunctional adenosylcobinamide kinase/adenosylcobinamide-phosphate guanylyltransferase, partial [Thalassobaculum sp.]
QHRADRQGRGWITVEEPLDLPAALTREAAAGRVLLVECLTTWLGNLMAHDQPVAPEVDRLLAGLDAGLPCDVLLVGNEVGFGIVPENRMAREFRDVAGRLHQELAARAGRVELVVAGIPVLVKG